jgi:nucleoid-associated protein YgaU
MKCFGALLLCAGVLSTVLAKEREITYDEYLTRLNEVIAQEKNAREGIAREQAMIENLRQQIAQIDLLIASVIQEHYAILGITEQDVLNAGRELASIRASFARFLLMTDDELFARRQEVRSQESHFSALKLKRVCMLRRIAALVNDAASLLLQIKIRLEGAQVSPAVATRSAPSQYTVGRSGSGRNLWEIAGEVYDDHFQWPRIYRANKKRIDRLFERYKVRSGDGIIRRPQDLVVPGWTLAIPQ